MAKQIHHVRNIIRSLSTTKITIKIKFKFYYNKNIIERKVNLILNLKDYYAQRIYQNYCIH